MFKMNEKKYIEEMNLEIKDNFRYFKPDLELKCLGLQKEAKYENELFYEIGNN